jgi:hypothetical protein
MGESLGMGFVGVGRRLQGQKFQRSNSVYTMFMSATERRNRTICSTSPHGNVL